MVKPYVIDQDVVRAWLERSCAAQGVPVLITDARTIAKIVAILKPYLDAQRAAAAAQKRRRVASG
jgi:hypothetical protein